VVEFHGIDFSAAVLIVSGIGTENTGEQNPGIRFSGALHLGRHGHTHFPAVRLPLCHCFRYNIAPALKKHYYFSVLQKFYIMTSLPGLHD
jgi:hypothetical protein